MGEYEITNLIGIECYAHVEAPMADLPGEPDMNLISNECYAHTEGPLIPTRK